MRAFIEDDLITASGRRNSEPYEEALNKPGVTAEDISLLVNRRLLRIEDRAGMSWLELTHDRLTGVARASRESRRQREAQAAAEAAQREAQEKERRAQQELREKARTLRIGSSLAGCRHRRHAGGHRRRLFRIQRAAAREGCRCRRTGC